MTITKKDGNGFINRMELRHVMMNLGERMSEEECDALVDVSAKLEFLQSKIKCSLFRKPILMVMDV